MLLQIEVINMEKRRKLFLFRAVVSTKIEKHELTAIQNHSLKTTCDSKQTCSWYAHHQQYR